MNARGGVGISGAPANTIGGTAAGAGNLISGNSNPSSGDAGIYLISGGATGNLIQGNLIGTDSMGMLALGNNHEGIYAENAPGNTIGGSVPGAGNVISGNHTRGIFLTNSSGTVIQGNLIGTKIDGVSAMGNTFHAVECEKNANNTVIGGNGSAGNRIGFSQTVFAGVRIRNNCTNNAIIGNAIFSNGPTGNGPSGGLGIDLGTVGTNANVACGGSSGSANMGENFPVLTQAVTGNGTGVRGTLNSRANTSFVLQFFANPACDPSGCGEGQIYLGQTSVTTSGCATNFVAELAASAPVGYALTATATDPANNTSEFSMCISAGPIPALTLSGPTNNQLKLAWTNTATGFVLKQTDSLWQPVQWTTVTNSPVITNGQFVVTQSLTSSNRFYLLSFE
jgi:hypothetical protein